MTERPICRTWADHEWDGATVVASGRGPYGGYYQRLATTCRRCRRGHEETRWITPPLPARVEMHRLRELDT